MSSGIDPLSDLKTPIRRMFRNYSGTLNLCYIKDWRVLEGLDSFLQYGQCRVINLVEPSHPDVLNYVLSQLPKAKDVLHGIHFDLWMTEFDDVVRLFNEAFIAHENSLVELSLKCRFPTNIVVEILKILTPNIQYLDLSENTLSDFTFLDPLISFIESSEVRLLRLVNCSIKAPIREKLVKMLYGIQTPFSLNAIEGVQFHDCLEIPKAIRQVLREVPSITRKKQMNYQDYSVVKHNEGNIQFIDHLRNILFMRRLVGSRVRVWWPATSDQNRTAFSGRFWPAKVLRANPTDLIFVVEYDNKEVDHVPCRYIQPLSPFEYGGGLSKSLTNALVGNYYFQCIMDTLPRKKRKARDNINCETDASISVLGNTAYMDNISTSTNARQVITPDVAFRCDNCGCDNFFDILNDANATVKCGLKTPQSFEDYDGDNIEIKLNINPETNVGLNERFSGNVLLPGEICEFRDPLDVDGSDPSDYVAIIKSVNSQEPLYECICIYQDNEEVVNVFSNDIRRVVLIPWYNWIQVALAIEKYLIVKRNDKSINDLINNARKQFLYPANVDPNNPFKGPPPNPLEMKLFNLEQYINNIGKIPHNHPRLCRKDVSYPANNSVSREGVDLELRKKQQKIDSLMEFIETLQCELQNEKNKYLELQTKFNCVICLDTQINCIMNPCGHFSVCHDCVKNLKYCPICRHKITRLKMISLN